MPYAEKGTVEDFIVRELQRLGRKYAEPEEMKREGD